jgi:prepilin-type N-terminal cleavage/methylation domain-containing protein
VTLRATTTLRGGRARRRGWRADPPPRGFSLLELLLTTVLILILFVLLYGRSSGSQQRRQKQACQQNLQTIYVALQIYAGDHDGWFPVKTNARTSEEPLSLLVPRYTSVTRHFICPGSRDGRLPEGEPFENRKISYAYYMGRSARDTAEVLLSDAQVNTQPKIQGQPVFSPDGRKPGNNHHRFGGNLVFGDGRMDMIRARAPFSILLTQGVVLLNPRP